MAWRRGRIGCREAPASWGSATTRGGRRDDRGEEKGEEGHAAREGWPDRRAKTYAEEKRSAKSSSPPVRASTHRADSHSLTAVFLVPLLLSVSRARFSLFEQRQRRRRRRRRCSNVDRSTRREDIRFPTTPPLFLLHCRAIPRKTEAPDAASYESIFV